MNAKLENLEKKLNIANTLIEELDLDNYEIMPSTELPCLPDPLSLTCTSDKKDDEVFSIETLRADFIMIRQNVMKLISTGQRILETASVLDVSDMKGSQLSAISSILQTVGTNLKMLTEIYRDICEIEKMRMCVTGKPTEGTATQINTGNTVNNTIVFQGDTSSLLDIIKQNQ